ncbi:golgin subfamily A member 6-like protein 24 [Engraulis encrasicolus]|uniref:golgin subfamily A member 6-like protein 24 n=1 Tax=Engraulis encrasicolus TaxID=184585 RepID=UPI002FD6AFFA
MDISAGVPSRVQMASTISGGEPGSWKELEQQRLQLQKRVEDNDRRTLELQNALNALNRRTLNQHEERRTRGAPTNPVTQVERKEAGETTSRAQQKESSAGVQISATPKEEGRAGESASPQDDVVTVYRLCQNCIRRLLQEERGQFQKLLQKQQTMFKELLREERETLLKLFDEERTQLMKEMKTAWENGQHQGVKIVFRRSEKSSVNNTDSDTDLSKDWFDEEEKKIIVEAERKLKALKERRYRKQEEGKIIEEEGKVMRQHIIEGENEEEVAAGRTEREKPKALVKDLEDIKQQEEIRTEELQEAVMEFVRRKTEQLDKNTESESDSNEEYVAEEEKQIILEAESKLKAEEARKEAEEREISEEKVKERTLDMAEELKSDTDSDAEESLFSEEDTNVLLHTLDEMDKTKKEDEGFRKITEEENEEVASECKDKEQPQVPIKDLEKRKHQEEIREEELKKAAMEFVRRKTQDTEDTESESDSDEDYFDEEEKLMMLEAERKLKAEEERKELEEREISEEKAERTLDMAEELKSDTDADSEEFLFGDEETDMILQSLGGLGEMDKTKNEDVEFRKITEEENKEVASECKDKEKPKALIQDLEDKQQQEEIRKEELRKAAMEFVKRKTEPADEYTESESDSDEDYFDDEEKQIILEAERKLKAIREISEEKIKERTFDMTEELKSDIDSDSEESLFGDEETDMILQSLDEMDKTKKEAVFKKITEEENEEVVSECKDEEQPQIPIKDLEKRKSGKETVNFTPVDIKRIEREEKDRDNSNNNNNNNKEESKTDENPKEQIQKVAMKFTEELNRDTSLDSEESLFSDEDTDILQTKKEDVGFRKISEEENEEVASECKDKEKPKVLIQDLEDKQQQEEIRKEELRKAAMEFVKRKTEPADEYTESESDSDEDYFDEEERQMILEVESKLKAEKERKEHKGRKVDEEKAKERMFVMAEELKSDTDADSESLFGDEETDMILQSLGGLGEMDKTKNEDVEFRKITEEGNKEVASECKDKEKPKALIQDLEVKQQQEVIRKEELRKAAMEFVRRKTEPADEYTESESDSDEDYFDEEERQMILEAESKLKAEKERKEHKERKIDEEKAKERTLDTSEELKSHTDSDSEESLFGDEDTDVILQSLKMDKTKKEDVGLRKITEEEIRKEELQKAAMEFVRRKTKPADEDTDSESDSDEDYFDEEEKLMIIEAERKLKAEEERKELEEREISEEKAERMLDMAEELKSDTDADSEEFLFSDEMDKTKKEDEFRKITVEENKQVASECKDKEKPKALIKDLEELNEEEEIRKEELRKVAMEFVRRKTEEADEDTESESDSDEDYFDEEEKLMVFEAESKLKAERESRQLKELEEKKMCLEKAKGKTVDMAKELRDQKVFMAMEGEKTVAIRAMCKEQECPETGFDSENDTGSDSEEFLFSDDDTDMILRSLDDMDKRKKDDSGFRKRGMEQTV